MEEQNELLTSRFEGRNNAHLPAGRTSPSSGRQPTQQQRWVPPSLQLRDAKLDANEATFRKIRSILNKLTPEKFDKLCQDILNIGIYSKVVLKGIVILIFEKAIDELRYSSLYANLCRRLYHEAPNFDAPQQVGSTISKPNTFRRLLIAKLQDEFENRNKKLEAFDSKDGPLSPEEEEQRLKSKQHMLGNIKFIGELYRLNILHESILHKCIKQLINKKKKGTIDDLAEDLECLCQIMTTCGRRLDHDKAKSLMDQYFNRLEYLQKKKTDLPSRIRFMIQDVIELRSINHWVPRKIQASQGPKTLGQIRTELMDDYPSLLLDPKTKTGQLSVSGGHTKSLKDPSYDLRNSTGLGFFPMTKKQQFNGLNEPLSPTFPTFHGEPTSPGPGFDFFSTPPKNPSATSSKLNGSFPSGPPLNRPFFQAPYMNGAAGRPAAPCVSPFPHPQQQVHPMYNGYSNGSSNFAAYPAFSGPQQFATPVNSAQNVSTEQLTHTTKPFKDKPQRFQPHRNTPSPPSSEIPNNDTTSRRSKPSFVPLQSSSKPDNQPIPQQPKTKSLQKPLYSAALNPGTSASPRRQNGNLKSVSPVNSMTQISAAVDKFQPSFQHVIDNAKKPNNRNSPTISTQEKSRNKKSFLNEKDVKEMLMKNAAEFFDKTLTKERVLTNIKDMKLPKKYMATLAEIFYEKSMFGSDEIRDALCSLCKDFVNAKLLTEESLISGLQSVFERLPDLETDLPRIKSITASLLARIISRDLLSLKDVASRLEGGYQFPLFLLTLQQIVKIESQDWLMRVFEESKIKMQLMMPEVSQNKKSMFEILSGKKLLFLLPLLHMEAKLNEQLTKNPSPAVVYRWIKENVPIAQHSDPVFINILTTCCLNYVTKESSLAQDVNRTKSLPKDIQKAEKELLVRIKPVLQKFTHDIANLQLHVLYAVQVFCYNNEFPKGLMLRLFNLLYTEDVVDEEVFILWKEDVNDEFPGKGKSLFQVNAWLTWLQEADTEEDEEET